MKSASRNSFIACIVLMELHDDKDDGGTQGNEKKCGALVKIEQSGVRRKLFQDDGTDAPGAYQDFITMNICEQGTQMCNRNWSRELKPEAKHESTYNKEGKVWILQKCYLILHHTTTKTQAVPNVPNYCNSFFMLPFSNYLSHASFHIKVHYK